MGRINDFDNLDDVVPEKIVVSMEAYKQLLKALEEPAKANEKLKNLMRGNHFHMMAIDEDKAE